MSNDVAIDLAFAIIGAIRDAGFTIAFALIAHAAITTFGRWVR